MREHNKIVCTDTVDPLLAAKPYSFLHKAFRKYSFIVCAYLLFDLAVTFTLYVLLHGNIFFPFVVQFGPAFVPCLYNLSKWITCTVQLKLHTLSWDRQLVHSLGCGLENWWWTKVSFLVQATRFFSSKHPDWLWGPALCSVGAGDSVPRFKDIQPLDYFPICASSPLVAIFDISKHSNIWKSCSRIFYNPFTGSVNWKDKSNFCTCNNKGRLSLCIS